MDGTLAVIFAIASLTDMALTDCPTGCLARSDATPRLAFQAGAVEFQNDIIGSQVYLGYDIGTRFGPVQPTIGLSVSDQGDTWVGAGLKWTSDSLSTGPVFAEASFMPGLHATADGPDIGGVVHFRSALGLGYRFDDGSTLTVSYDHRSNGDMLNRNPGLETISVRYAIVWD